MCVCVCASGRKKRENRREINNKENFLNPI